MIRGKKPKKLQLWDGEAECKTEEPVFNEAYGIDIQAFLYDEKQIDKLIIWLIKAKNWINNKEDKFK